MTGTGVRPAGTPASHRAARRKKRRISFIAVLVMLVLVAGASYVAIKQGIGQLDEQLDRPEDYAGSGHGSVRVTVKPGQTTSDIAATLVAKDVVKSAEAFTAAAAADPGEETIEPGVYSLREQMSAESALALLLSDQTRVQVQVTVPEGLTADEIVTTIARQTDIRAADLQAVLKQPVSLGLPPYAKGREDGYLFPASYTIGPNATARDVLVKMVKRFKRTARDLNLDAAALAHGVTPHDVVTVASMVEAEASRPEDFGKVATVIYNRVDAGIPLQLDSTVNYVAGSKGDVDTTAAQRTIDSPYNTYRYPGLPPGPIAAPGSAALEAAIDPTPGSWRYFVTVNPRTGKTLFARTLSRHNANVDKLERFCEASKVC